MNASASPMRWALARLAAILLVAVPCVQAQRPPSYTLSFDDEFNNSTVNTSVWQYRTDGKLYSQQLAANVSESGGYLHVAVKQQTSGSYSYTGGGVISLGGFGYGYYEASVKVPPGSGWHSSFWAMAYNGTDTGTAVADQELDFMEQDSGSPTSYTANYHYWPTTYQTGATIASPNMNAGFNTIGCLFTPYGAIYYLNGVEVEEINTSSYPNNLANIWLTCIATQVPDTTKLPSEFLVDWVHYYAPSASGSAPSAPINLQASSTATQVSLSWSSPLSDAASYTVKRATVSGGPYTTLASGLTSPSYTDATVSGSTTYYYVVDGVSSSSVSSADSAEISVVPGTVIVDDTSTTSFATTGTWTSSTYTAGYYGTDYLTDGDAGTGKTATFTPNLPSTAVYQVYARWTSGANRASNALFDVLDSSGNTTTLTENQQVNGGAWVNLGSFAFNSGTSGYVRIRDTGANGYVIADAVEFVPANAVILDNSAASGVTISGAWSASSYNTGYYGTNYLQDGASGGGKSVTFAPTLSSSGSYQVYVRWASAANRASNTPIDVTDGSGTVTTTSVNQQANGGQWNLIGTYTFNAGSTGTVKIRDDGANGYVIADAVEFVKQ